MILWRGRSIILEQKKVVWKLGNVKQRRATYLCLKQLVHVVDHVGQEVVDVDQHQVEGLLVHLGQGQHVTHLREHSQQMNRPVQLTHRNTRLVLVIVDIEIFKIVQG